MSTELMVYDKIADPIHAMTVYGDDIAKSGLLGCSNISQGRIMAMECFARGTTAIALSQQFHIIDNKLSMKADAMLAEFRRLGGKHKVISRTAERAEIELASDGETQRFAFTWEEALLEPFVWDGKRKDVLAAIVAKKTDKLTLNPNYASPRKRMQMLWARVVSDGVRTMSPEVNFGRYSPEDLEDVDGDDDAAPTAVNATKTNGTPRKSVSEVLSEQAAQASQSTQSSPASQVEDADFEPAEPVAASKTALMDSIRSLWAVLGADADDQQAMVKKQRCGRPGAGALIGLDDEQLRDLEGKLKATVSESTVQPPAAADDPPFDVDGDAIDSGPVGEVQLANITKLLEVLGETNPMVYDNVATQLEQLGEGTKLRMLTAHQANVLINDLKKGDTVLTGMRLFIAESLNQVKRGTKGEYNRIDFSFADDSFVTQEYGLEGAIEQRNARAYAKLAASQEKAVDKTPHYATEAGNQ